MILRLINNPSSYETIELPLAIHVHQRLESIVYKNAIDQFSVPIAYLDSEDIYAAKNLALLDRSDTLPENNLTHNFNTKRFVEITGSSYTTDYPELWITDQVIEDAQGNKVPLFYAFELLDDTTSVEIEHVTNSGSVVLKHGFVLNEDKTRVYFNFTNEFNPLTGYYSLYFITAVTTGGVITKGLLNPISSIREATWEDLDPDTGLLDDSFVYFTKEKTSNYTYYFNISGTYYVKPRSTSIIAPIEFANGLSISGWFPRFTNGQFSHVGKDSKNHVYWFPEFDVISFYPSRPYFFDSNAEYIAVNKNIIFIGRKNLGINQSTRPLDIIISDINDVPLYALTTKTSKNETKYLDDIYWSTDEIASWDNESGLIEISIELRHDWHIHISYYYEVKEIQYSYTNLNPLHNDLVYNHYYVYYVKPDQSERGLHHLIVRNDGIIVDCSDEDYALLIDGIYNTETFIGMTYRSSVSDSYYATDWVSLYTTENVNEFQYLVLAEYFFIETKQPSMIDPVDVSRQGNKLVEPYNETVYRNPKLYHSEYAATYFGTEFPQNNSYVVRLSKSLLEDFGGVFTEEEIMNQCRTYVASGKYIIFEWDEEIRNLTIDNSVDEEITLFWSYVGTGYCYNIYRSTTETIGFELIDTICSNDKEISYTDSNIDSDMIYYYYIKPTKDDIEYPASYTIGAQAR